jgi:DNA polymerase-1
MPRLFLLDGTALAYRAHFALARSGLRTADGRPTGATYGFTMTLRRILEQEQPDLIAVAFDPPGLTFRHERYGEYKATRQKMPEELSLQLEDLREVVRAHGIPVFEVRNYEADDVIGTLACQAVEAGYEVLIVTGDKDLMQLVGDHVRLYNVFKQEGEVVIEDVEAVRTRFGTTPAGVIDVLALMGDASDHVPGVKGIGEKGAIKLIQEYGSVASLLERLAEVKGKVRELIERDRDALLLSRELVTLDCSVPLEPGFSSLKPPAPDPQRLRALYQRLGFTSLLKTVVAPGPRVPEARDYRIARDGEQLAAMIGELAAAGTFALDTETNSLYPLRATLVGLSFCAQPLRAWYVPLNQTPPVLPGGPAQVLEALRPLLTDARYTRIGQNTKYDWLVLERHGIAPPPPAFDTMVASYCVSGAARRHNLDELARVYFDLEKIPTTALIGTGKGQITMDQVPIERVAEYACEDADVTWRLRAVLEKELGEQGARELYEELELPLIPVLAAMERRGIAVDLGVISEIGVELERELQSALADLHALAGEPFNVNSTKALGELLFEKLRIQDAAGVKRVKRTRTGWSTDHATLAESYGDVPIVQRLLAYREVQKLKSTYVDTLPGYVDPRTGRIHPSFSQVTAATGRLSCSEPNLQNVPVRTERGAQLRKAFVARPPDARGEWVLLSADYSQVELRVLAHYTGDPALVRAFAEGRDIHASTAAIVFGVPEDAVTREMRSRAKAINFGLLYGMGPARLARDTGLSFDEARGFIERYFRSFPSVRGWLDSVLDGAREKGYVETLLGRRRHIPDVRSQDGRLRSMAENAAVNTPIQGSAADIIKRAMLSLERRIAAAGLSAQLLLQVHDELLLEAPVAELPATRALVRECMEGALPLRVPLAVELGEGRNWLEAH